MGILSTGVDYLLVYKFIKGMITPFKKTDAYKLGIIDDEGNILKKMKDLETTPEKKAYTGFNRMIWNLKKLIRKIPVIGKSAVTSWAAAAYLFLKEGSSEDELYDLKKHTFLKFVHEDLQKLSEDAPTTSLSKGTFAGTGADDIPISKKNQKKHKKRNSTSGKSGRKILSAKLKSRG
jgi:hypothetical protein